MILWRCQEAPKSTFGRGASPTSAFLPLKLPEILFMVFKRLCYVLCVSKLRVCASYLSHTVSAQRSLSSLVRKLYSDVHASMQSSPRV